MLLLLSGCASTGTKPGGAVNVESPPANAKSPEQPDSKLSSGGDEVRSAISEQESDLRLAARNGEIEEIKALLSKGTYIDAKDEQGWTALREAVFQEHVAAVKLLLDKKADPNARDPKDGSTSLHWAAQVGNDEIVRALLKAGADPNLPDTFSGSTPLYFAATGGHIACVSAMIAKGADVNATDKFGDPLLPDVISSYESAVRRGAKEEARALRQIIQILRRAGAEEPN